MCDSDLTPNQRHVIKYYGCMSLFALAYINSDNPSVVDLGLVLFQIYYSGSYYSDFFFSFTNNIIFDKM